MIVKIKKLTEKAVIPKKVNITDAGFDLVATSVERDEYGNLKCGTGLSIEIPQGYVGLLFARSSISKKNLDLANSVGVIDSGYRGEIIAKFKPTGMFSESDWDEEMLTFKVGERVCQLIILPYPEIEFSEVDSLNDSDRGEGGFGSTGK